MVSLSWEITASASNGGTGSMSGEGRNSVGRFIQVPWGYPFPWVKLWLNLMCNWWWIHVWSFNRVFACVLLYFLLYWLVQSGLFTGDFLLLGVYTVLGIIAHIFSGLTIIMFGWRNIRRNGLFFLFHLSFSFVLKSALWFDCRTWNRDCLPCSTKSQTSNIMGHFYLFSSLASYPDHFYFSYVVWVQETYTLPELCSFVHTEVTNKTQVVTEKLDTNCPCSQALSSGLSRLQFRDKKLAGSLKTGLDTE